jgi:putative ABC transport system permease protein
VINIALKKNFNDFINEYRIQEVTRKMQDPAFDRITLLGIAIDSGFNSKSTFNRAFRQMTGKTPAEYKRELKKEFPTYHLTPNYRSAAIILNNEATSSWSFEKLNRNYMFKNYLKIAWRNAIKNRAHSFISLVSLVFGLTFFCLIMLWVKDELSYDKEVPDAGSVFRIESNLTLKDGPSSAMSAVGWPVGRALPAEYPEVEALTYMSDWAPIINFKGHKFYESAMYADKSFFSVLGYKLSEGNAAMALGEPYSIVISQQLKQKYFGNTRALGKTLMLNDTVPYKITGVLTGQPGPSHLKFDMLGSFSSRLVEDPKGWEEEFTKGWFDINVYNYVKLKAGVSPEGFNKKVEDIVLRDGKAIVNATGFKSKLFLRPVKDIYLYSGMSTGAGPVGSIKSLKLFAAIGFFILIIACLNFINLTTAKSVERAKEIGIKKVLGSGRSKLIWQFLMESALFCVCALIISIAAVSALLPLFNSFTGKLITGDMLFSAGNILLMLAIIVLVIPLAGFYPALVLSAYQPVKVLKGSFSHSGSGNLLRKILVVGQFSLSILFILSTTIIWKQMRFMQNQSLGFDKDKIVLINTTKVPWGLRNGKAEVFKSAVLRHAGITAISGNAAVPGHMGWGAQFAYPEGKTKDQGLVVEYIPVDNDYTKTLGLQFTAGQGFAADNIEDQEKNLVINEAAVKAFGWGTAENAIGKKLATSGKEGKVIGVLKDYHQHGLQTQINPVVLGIGRSVNMFAIHYSAANPRSVIDAVKSEWQQIFEGYEFDYKFMDEDFQQQYATEEKFETLFGLAAFLSISIACLGLLGLAIYTAQKRIKEIGIRKVLGASVYSITKMLSMDFLQLVIIAILVASPLAWYFMNQWLQGFAYRITIYWWLFPLAGFVAIIIALFTISFHAIKAALSNPVKSLKVE